VFRQVAQRSRFEARLEAVEEMRDVIDLWAGLSEVLALSKDVPPLSQSASR